MNTILRYMLSLNRSMLVALSFMLIIACGTGLLMLPISNVSGEGLPFVDALFTATSASCVTGLIVVDTGTHFTRFGQMVIISMIQIGGLGLMTITTLFSLGLGKQLNLRAKLLVQESLNQADPSAVIQTVKRVITYTFIIEIMAGTALTCMLFDKFGTEAVYLGFWHAVSAFCNAGFDLFGNFNSLTGYADDYSVNLTIMALIILGGIGFTVIGDVARNLSWKKLSLHTKIVLSFNTGLLVLGTVFFWLLEQNNPRTLGFMGTDVQWLAAAFQSVSARTAGFNTVDLAAMMPATYVMMSALMFIGASPASTGGGLKTTTFAVLVLTTLNQLRGKKEVVIFNRRIDQELVNKAFSIFLMSVLWVLLAVFLIMALDTGKHNFELVVFEVFSAFGTVGLGVGITPEWNVYCKLVLIATMFIGRISILTFGLSFFSHKIDKVRYPSERISVG